MNHQDHVTIGSRRVAPGEPAYFIADIAANHDGDLERAKELIHLCAEAGADCAKFQHFLARQIVSDVGFRRLGGQVSHQAKWDKPVYEVYEQYELNRDWTPELAATARAAGIDFMTTPYDADALDLVDELLPAYKVGSGDITWTGFLELIAARGKPVVLATGAATMEDVERAVQTVLALNPALVLLQCNTNYTGSLENLHHVNLHVLRTYAQRWPGLPLGLSDHTPGHATVLGAVALGGCVIEKHFTDDTSREGPDHPFSMTPATWRDMVDRTRELEAALGDGVKRIEANEQETVVVQRRCLRAACDLSAGTVLREEHIEALRPAPAEALEPHRLAELIGRPLARAKQAGEEFLEGDVDADR